MRKIIIGLVTLFFSLCILFLISGIVNKVHEHDRSTKKISKFPSFTFTTLDNKPFNSSDIKSGPILLIRFHPECEHCQYEISELFKSIIPTTGIKIIMISSAPVDTVTKFLNNYKYKNYSSVIPLLDLSYTFEEIFGRSSIPSNYIYNEELKLVKILEGEVKIETLLKYLEIDRLK
jgi:hypothetical protein